MLQLRLALQRCIRLDTPGTILRTRVLESSLSRPATRWYSTPPPPPDLSEGERTIYQKLTDKFSPNALHVQDISGGCGSFYAIIISSEAFRGLSMVKQHQLVNKALKDEISSIHGLQLKTNVPESNAE